MFWPSTPDRHARREEISELVRQRLRLALDFATLGAYELADASGEEATGASSAEPSAEAAHTAWLPARGSGRAEIRCSSPITSSRACGASARAPRRLSRDRHGHDARTRHRGGSVTVPEQPCVCADGSS
jgi:hypothetical protein